MRREVRITAYVDFICTQISNPLLLICGREMATEGDKMAKPVTAETVSFEQIKALRADAGQAGDSDMAAVCDLAIDGEIDTDDYTVLSGHMASRLRRMSREEAYALCADAINAASASED